MLASVVMILWPNDLLRPARNVTQVMAPLQLLTLEATRRATGSIRALTQSDPSPGEQADLARESQALENENVLLREQMSRLQSRIDELAGIRRQGFPADGVLVPARVISLDAAPGRDSVVVGKGHVQEVEPDAWVVTHVNVDAGTRENVRDACAVLARQCLIGWVEQSAPLTSRVVLLSDRLASKPMRVYIAPRRAYDTRRGLPSAGGQAPPRPDADTAGHVLLAVKGEPVPFALEGAGGGRMRIRDIPARLAAHIQVGDLVTSDPNDPKLPLAMVIGEIEKLTQNRDNPVYCSAVVRYRYDPKTLGQVFIVDLSKTTGRTSPPPQP